ncbi:MAG TPA: cytochrome c oxidase subunit 3 [Candidatus Acidoferrum sp.]|nr:cytochrome c oxidase subunit 3 [Candidatus Acidoferrum sp.]
MSAAIHQVATASQTLPRVSTRPGSAAKVRSGAEAASRSGIWVAIFTITMTFAAFTSALFVRQGSGGDWVHFALPSILYANTFALLLSSVTLEMARRSVAAKHMIDSESVPLISLWLFVTLLLGFSFLVGQYEAWRQLAAQGFYLATNPNSSFYYVLTAMHGLHVMGGIAALVFVMGRLAGTHAAFRRSTFESTVIYWHFMGVLWLYLLLVLRTKL